MASSSGEEEFMSNELYNAAVRGDEEVFSGIHSNEYLLKKTYSKNNILHIAIKHNNASFAAEAQRRFPDLWCEGNSDGNTPLHFLAEFGKQMCRDKMANLLADEPISSEVEDIKMLLENYHMYVEGIVNPFDETLTSKLTDEKPFRMKNSEGNTPAHVALIYSNFTVAPFLIRGGDVYTICNNLKEAPLHLAVKHNVHGAEGHQCLYSLKPVNQDIRPVVDGSLRKGLTEMLLEKASYVACWRDTSGLTPLHRAASTNKYYIMDGIMLILYLCPQSVEVCDDAGKTILHHIINKMSSEREVSKLLSNPSIGALVNHRDQEGNTPLHLAVINKDVIMMDHLQKAGGNTEIKNQDGLTVSTLKQQYNISEIMKTRTTEKYEFQIGLAKRKEISSLRCYLRSEEKEVLRSKDSEGRNFLHLLLDLEDRPFFMNDYLPFITDILKMMPELVSQTDSHGDTPVHVLARNDMSTDIKKNSRGPTKIELVKSLMSIIDRAAQNIHENPWFKQNGKGNTPLHEAIIVNNYQIINKLAAQLGPDTAKLVNQHNETVIHLLASQNRLLQVDEDVTTTVIEHSVSVSDILDTGGLSPLMRAFGAGNFEFAVKIYSKYPQAAEIWGPNGMTIWHQLFRVLPPVNFNLAGSVFSHEIARDQLKAQDMEGNTALHWALNYRRFDLAKLFLGNDEPQEARFFDEYLLDIQNNEGITPRELIGALEQAPSKFEEFMGKVHTMVGIRSIWGIPSTQRKEYVNTIGVIAALLTTITFTAAFTVPGGSNQEKGTPLLIGNPSFQVFIISDIVAMCLSMMVLFCLLWIMATGNTSKSVLLLDFIIMLLLASFYTTVVTFMTGLYATTHLVKPGIAIFALVLCSMLLLLMHHYFIMNFMIPLGKALLVFVERLSKKFMHHICCCFPSSEAPHQPSN